MRLLFAILALLLSYAAGIIVGLGLGHKTAISIAMMLVAGMIMGKIAGDADHA